jgi:hypothetical protein
MRIGITVAMRTPLAAPLRFVMRSTQGISDAKMPTIVDWKTKMRKV